MVAIHSPKYAQPERSDGRIAHICAPAQCEGRGASLRLRLLTALGRACYEEPATAYWLFERGISPFLFHPSHTPDLRVASGAKRH